MKNAVFWDVKTQFVPHMRHITSLLQIPAGQCYVRFEVHTAATMKNAVLWDMTTPCFSCKVRLIGGTYHLYLQKWNISPPSSEDEVICSSETSLLTRTARRHHTRGDNFLLFQYLFPEQILFYIGSASVLLPYLSFFLSGPPDLNDKSSFPCTWTLQCSA
jgi:hypothetical protein